MSQLDLEISDWCYNCFTQVLVLYHCVLYSVQTVKYSCIVFVNVTVVVEEGVSFVYYSTVCFILFVCFFRSSLYQDVPHGFDVCGATIVSTGVVVILWPSCSKPDSGINIPASILVIGENTNSCFASSIFPISPLRFQIKPFFVTETL